MAEILILLWRGGVKSKNHYLKLFFIVVTCQKPKVVNLI